MTREEAIAIIRKEYLCVDRDCDIERSCGKCDLAMPSKEPILQAYKLAIKALEQEPCTDAISRVDAIKAMDELEKEDVEAYGCKIPEGFDGERARLAICLLPSVKPQYTDAEIQKMQDLESVEIQTAYEIGKEEGSSVLDRIRDEFISLYPKNYAGELELGWYELCVFT